MVHARGADMGDLIVVEAHRQGEPRRIGEILEVLGTADNEHYRVRWDDGRDAIFYPGSDAVIQHARPRKRSVRTSAP